MRRLAALVLLAGCGARRAPDAAPEKPVEPPADAVTKTTENGPVKATVKAWPAKPSLLDPIYVRLDVDAPAGVAVDAPFQEAGDDRLGRFRVVGFTRDVERRADGGERYEQTYTLEAPASGRQRVPPLRIEMTDARDPSKAKKPEELLTDEAPLDVAPVPTEQASAPLRAERGPLDPDVGRTSAWTVAAAVAGVAAAAALAVVVVRRARALRRVAAQRSAYDVAMGQLAALAGRGAPATDAADAWFVDLSGVVRRYLERRYEIRAPELTTEEFLQVATTRPELTLDHRARLTSFLDRCDRVKFAGWRPASGESLETLAAARAFVEDTRLAEAANP